MRKISKNRGDDDVVSSTNGSGSVAGEHQEAEQLTEDNEKGADEKVDNSDNAQDSEELNESTKKSKAKAKSKKKKSDKSNKKEEEDVEYEVEKIIDSKRIKGKLHYLIRWKGYSADSDTWEPHNTLSCPELINKFNEEFRNVTLDPPTRTRRLHTPAYLAEHKIKKENSKNDSPKTSKKRKAISKKSKSPTKKAKSNWDSEKANENDEYEVERILEVQLKKNGERKFLIHWKGWSNKFDSWEPENNLNCPELIKKFMEKVEAARSVESRSLRVAPGTTNRFTLQDPSSGRRLSKRRGQRQRVRYDDAE